MESVHRASEERQQGVGVQLGADLSALKQAVGQVSFARMQGDDLFLDGVLGYQPVNGHRALLANAVGTVTGLIFHRWVPPGIEVDHIVGAGEVKATAASLQADEEDFTCASLECIDSAFVPALLNVMNALTGSREVPVQLLAATHSPLVLASVEPDFERSRMGGSVLNRSAIRSSPAKVLTR